MARAGIENFVYPRLAVAAGAVHKMHKASCAGVFTYLLVRQSAGCTRVVMWHEYIGFSTWTLLVLLPRCDG